MNILIIPAWYNPNNPLDGIFFHEYSNAISLEANVTILNFKYQSFSNRLKKKGGEDEITGKKYNLIQVNYCNPLPGKWLGLSAFFQKREIIKKSISLVKKHIEKKNKFDIIHIQSVCNNITPIIGLSLADELSIPYIVTEHYTHFKEAGDSIFRPFTSLREIKQIVQKASLRIGVSNYACKYFENCFECDFETISNLITNEFINKQLNLNSDNKELFNFICIGSFQARKGQLILIEAFAKVEKIYKNITLTFVGSGADKEKMIHLATSLGVISKLSILDNMSKKNILELLDSSHVLVSASEKETFGLTIIEAFFRGKPALSTKSGGPQELINDTNGLLCEIGDIEDMAKNMKYIYENYSNYKAEDIRNDAINKYSEKAIVPIMMEKYKSVLLKY